MKPLLIVLLAFHVARLRTGADTVLTNDVQLIAKRFDKTLNSVLTELRAFRRDSKISKFDDSLPSMQVTEYCSPPFVKQGSLCLLAVCSAAQWSEARQTCDAKGSDLIWLENRGEHSAANDLFVKSCASASRYWTSLHLKNGKFVWRDSEVNNYTNVQLLDLMSIG